MIDSMARTYAGSKANYKIDQDKWKNALKEAYNYSKKEAGVPLNRKLQFVLSVEKLECMVDSMKKLISKNNKKLELV